MSEPVLLDATLKPPPALSARVLMIVLGAVFAMNVAIATPFVLKGLWPVTPFMGLDVALLGWAFHASRRAAMREERVLVTPSRLFIAKRPPKGAPREIELNPYWARVQMDEPPEHGSQLTVWSHGKGVRLGQFLPPQERASFAERLKIALYRARTTASFGS